MGGYVVMKTLDSVNIPIRKDETHKGDYGKILLIGGSANMGGAIMLAARACVYSGSGLIDVERSRGLGDVYKRQVEVDSLL